MNSSSVTNVFMSFLIVGILGVVIYRQQDIPASPSASIATQTVLKPMAPKAPQVVQVPAGKVGENEVPEATAWKGTDGLQDAMAMQENLANSIESSEHQRQQLFDSEKAKMTNVTEKTQQGEPQKKVIAVSNPFRQAPSTRTSWVQQMYRGSKAIQSKHTQQLPECESGSIDYNRAPASNAGTLPPIHLEPIGEQHHEKIVAYNVPDSSSLHPQEYYPTRSKCEQAILDNLNGKK